MPNSLSELHTLHAWEDNQITERCTQGEYAGKVLQFKLVDKDGTINLSNCLVQYAVTRPDKTEDLLDCTVDNGIVKCNLTYSVTSVVGLVHGEVRVIGSNDSGIIKFYGVNLRVYKGVSDEAAEQSEPFQLLYTLLHKVAALIPDDEEEAYVAIMDEVIAEGGLNPVASGLIYDALQSQNAEINKKMKFEDCTVTGKTADECIDEGTLYKIKLTTGIVTNNSACSMICVDSITKLMQYAFTRGGYIVFRSVSATNGVPTSGESWTSWDYLPTYSKVFDMIVRGFIGLEAVEYNLYDSTSKTDLYTYMSQPDYDDYNTDSPYSYTYIPAQDGFNEDEENDKSQPAPIQLPSGSRKIIIHDTVSGEEWTETGITSNYKIKNLIPNRRYSYIAFYSSGNIIQSGVCQANGQVRMIDATCGTTTNAPFNVRDLGGWTCYDGTTAIGKLKYGMIYRGGELNKSVTLTTAQQNFFRNVLGIKDEIDLRSNSGASGITDTALGIGVSYTRIPLLYYQLSLAEGEKYATLIKRIANNIKENKVTYIHCQAGADRTGQLCMMIEAICGVSQSDIDRDYELTSFSFMPDGTRNYRIRSASTNADWKQFVLGVAETDGATFRDKVVNYLIMNGVSADEINIIRSGLIDGNPAKLSTPYAKSTIYKTLSHVIVNNDAETNTVVESGNEKIDKYQPFKARILANDGYIISSVSVTMGSTDVTSLVYSSGIINIPSVTGNVVITASATSLSDLIAAATQEG